MPPPIKYCAQCGGPFESTHHSKRFCTIMCQVKYARIAKTARDRGQALSGGEIEARQQAIKDAVKKIPLEEGQPTPLPSPVTPPRRPFEGDGSGTESFIDIARDANIPHFGKKEVEINKDDPSFWEEGPKEG